MSSIGKALKKPKNHSKSKSLSDLTRAALHNDYRFQHATKNGLKRQASTESKGSERSSIDRNSLDAVSLGNQSSLGDADEDQMSVDDIDYQSSPTHSRTSSQISNADDFISDKPRKESNDTNAGKTVSYVTLKLFFYAILCDYCDLNDYSIDFQLMNSRRISFFALLYVLFNSFMTEVPVV